MDKCTRMKFHGKKGEEWYEGVVSSYNVIMGIYYSIYFPSDGQTEEASFDDEDL